jgi:hypothetical protein
LQFGSKTILCFRDDTDFGETELGSGRVFETEVFEVHANGSDFGEQSSELSGNVVDENDQLGEVLCNAVLPGNSGNARVAACKSLGDSSTSSGNRRIGKRANNGVEVVPIVLENTDDLVGVSSKDLHPEFRLATGDPGCVTKTLTNEADGSIAPVEKAGGKKRSNDLGNVRDQSNAAIVLCRIQSNWSSSEVESERLNGQIGGAAIGNSLVVRDDPRPTDEEVSASGYCAASLATGHRMRSDVARNVRTESTQFTEWGKLYARDIGDESRRIGGQLDGNRLSHNIRRNADNNERWVVALVGRSSCAIVDSQANRRRRDVGKDDIDAESPKTESDARAKKSGANDANGTCGSGRTSDLGCDAHDFLSTRLL